MNNFDEVISKYATKEEKGGVQYWKSDTKITLISIKDQMPINDSARLMYNGEAYQSMKQFCQINNLTLNKYTRLKQKGLITYI